MVGEGGGDGERAVIEWFTARGVDEDGDGVSEGSGCSGIGENWAVMPVVRVYE